MEQSPRLSLSYVAPSQAQKHVTVNETFRRLDALAQLTVRSRSISAEPGAPAEGDGYILPAEASGPAWDYFSESALAFFQDGAWTEIASVEGLRAFVVDEAALIVFDGVAWAEISAAAESAPQFGVNASADATNRLSVKSDAVLFSEDNVTPGSGDCRVKVNKSAAAQTASHLFQTGFSGRAEFGLTGDDDFHIKLSTDGLTFYEVGKFFLRDVFGITDLPHFTIGDVGVVDNLAALQVETTNVLSAIFVNTETQGSSQGAGIIGAVKNNPSAGDHRLGFFLLGSRGGAQNNYNQAGMQAFTETDWSSDRASCLTFSTTPTGSTSLTEQIRITADGDVGVGTSSPSTRLDVDGPVRVKSYTVAGAPSASASGAGAIIYVSNETGGATLAFSDGTNWRRVTDRAVIS